MGWWVNQHVYGLDDLQLNTMVMEMKPDSVFPRSPATPILLICVHEAWRSIERFSPSFDVPRGCSDWQVPDEPTPLLCSSSPLYFEESNDDFCSLVVCRPEQTLVRQSCAVERLPRARVGAVETVGELTEVCSQIVFNACAWHELEDLTSCGHSASLRGQWQNGLRQVTNA